jgi:hypothetical protein
MRRQRTLDFFYSYAGNTDFFCTYAGFFYDWEKAHLARTRSSALQLHWRIQHFSSLMLDVLTLGTRSCSPCPLFLFYSYAGNHITQEPGPCLSTVWNRLVG